MIGGGPLGLLEIEFLEMWTPFQSKNGICASTLECGQKGKKKTLFLTLGKQSSYFNIWSMRHWRLLKVGQSEL
jgi:hypothetical protein